MKSQIVLAICISLLFLASAASAATVWNPAANGIVPPATGDWGEAANWTNDVPGVAEDKAVFNVDGAADCLVTDAQSFNQFVQGDNGSGGVIRVMDGGSLTTGSVWSGVGYNSTAHMIVETGGSVTFGNHMWVGLLEGASGTLDIIGGNIRVEEMTGLGWNGGTGTLNLIAGVLDLHNLNSTNLKSIGEGSVFNITNGVLIMDGDQAEKIDDFVAAGKLVGFGGEGIVNVDFDERNAGKTTVTYVHPLEPFPSTEGSFVAPGAVELSWTLPDPCVPGQPVPVNVYLSDDYDTLLQFTDPASMRVVNNQTVTSIVVQVQPKTRYYWAVDSYVGSVADPVLGPIFSFIVDNPPPVVDAGADLVTWLDDDGLRTKNLDATVTDDEAYTVQWTVISEPNDPNNPDAVITDPSAEDTSITLSALGEYVLQLEAFDGEGTSSDTITINVYNDGCEAAKSLPDYVIPVGDLNGDCKVDEADLALLEENWLTDHSLTEP